MINDLLLIKRENGCKIWTRHDAATRFGSSDKNTATPARRGSCGRKRGSPCGHDTRRFVGSKCLQYLHIFAQAKNGADKVLFVPPTVLKEMESIASNDTIFRIVSEDVGRNPFPRPVTIIAAVCAIIFSVVGVLGNLATIVALLKYTRLRRHATTAFVISLCCSDLIFSSVNLPLTASRYLNEAWVLGDTLCRIFPFFFYGNVAVSLLSMVAITINRYVLISKPNIYARLYTGRGIALMLLAIWTLSFSLLIPPLLGIWGTLGLDSATFSCTILKKDGASPKKPLFVVGFVIPCVVISVSYLCIYWRVRKSRKNLEAHAGGERRHAGGGFQRREDSRVTKLMLTIFLCFLMCFMPLMLVNVIDDEIEIPVLHVVASVLAWASSVVNPFIYAGTNKLYREAYKQTLCPIAAKSPIVVPKATHSHSSKVSSARPT